VHSEIGRRILNRLAAELTETALIEVPPRQEGMTMVQILSPKKEHAAQKPARVGKEKKGKEQDGAASAAPPAPREKKKARTPTPTVVGDRGEKP
jgi:hypothetical protein